jgi:hypothetical protein
LPKDFLTLTTNISYPPIFAMCRQDILAHTNIAKNMCSCQSG